MEEVHRMMPAGWNWGARGLSTTYGHLSARKLRLRRFTVYKVRLASAELHERNKNYHRAIRVGCRWQGRERSAIARVLPWPRSDRSYSP